MTHAEYPADFGFEQIRGQPRGRKEYRSDDGSATVHVEPYPDTDEWVAKAVVARKIGTEDHVDLGTHSSEGAAMNAALDFMKQYADGGVGEVHPDFDIL
jgi:hypothetical protein